MSARSSKSPSLIPFIRKESIHVLRDVRMLAVVLVMPVVMMLLFGFAISMEVNNVNVVVTWQQYNDEVRSTVDRLAANPYITLKGSIGYDEIYTTLQRGDADAVVVFGRQDPVHAPKSPYARPGSTPAATQQVQVVVDASNPTLSQSGNAYIQAIIAGNDDNHAADIINTRFLFNPRLKSAYNFVPGIMGMLFLLVCSMMTAVSIVREKETGTMELLLVSPVRPWQIIISKMFPFFVLSCIDLALILFISIYALEVPIGMGIFPIIVVTLLYLVLSLGFGLLVSTLSSNQVMAMLITGMVMIMPVVMLSGMIYPVDNLPPVLAQISYIVPARWYISAMRGLMIEGLTFADVVKEIAILSGMTLLILIVAIRKFKDRI